MARPLGLSRRHFQDDHVLAACTRFLLAQAKPANLVMCVKKVRPVDRPIADFLAHDRARGIDSAFASLEYLHGRADDVACRINIRDVRPQLLVDDHSAAVVDGDAERIDLQPRPRPFAKRLETRSPSRLRVHPRGYRRQPGRLPALSITKRMADTVAPSRILDSLLAHLVDGVGAGFRHPPIILRRPSRTSMIT